MKKLVLALCLLLLVTACASAEGMRPAEKMTVGTATHFLIDKDEQKDFAIQLNSGDYYVVWDVQRMEKKPWSMSANVQLLKSNGSIVQSQLLALSELQTVVRVAKKFNVAKPFAARLRVTGTDEPIEVWMTIVPAKKMTFKPWAFPHGELQPLAVGATEGKGGTLDQYAYAFHAGKLPAGKYDVSLYFKRQDGKRSSISGTLERYDELGIATPIWTIYLSELGTEARVDKRLVLTKTTNVILRVQNTDTPVEYTIGVEKATD